MARQAPFSKGEDPKIKRPRKFKECYCGGHSANDHKKSKQHHSTKIKLSRRQLRRNKQKMKCMYCEHRMTLKEILQNKDICDNCLSEEIKLDNVERLSINLYHMWHWIFVPQE